MAQRYEDGGKLPYRVRYNVRGKSSRSQELRFSAPAIAQREVAKLVNRGHSVDYDEWDFISKRYITKERYA